jgi:hypothetical protein
VGTVRNLRTRRIGQAAVLAVALLSTALTAGCTSAPQPGTASPAASATSSPSSSGQVANGSGSGLPSNDSSTSAKPAPDGATMVINIVIANGKVTPNGQKLNAKVGQQVVMNVTSDTADEVHAHIGGDGYELEVPAGKPTMGSFTLTSAGSFEVESHHLNKIIVILNAS